MERGDRGDGASVASDPVDRCRRHSGDDSDRADRVLGTDGLRGDGWARNCDAADPRIPASAVRCVVPDQADFGTATNNFNRSSCACPRLINEKRWARKRWPTYKMMDTSRHKSVDTLRGYVRDAELFRDHAGIGLL